MSHITTHMIKRLIALGLCVALSIPTAYAVVKNLKIVDSEGNSLANTKVTIVFPDGTEDEEETDDEGFLYYNFPKDGDYTVRYPGGQMSVNVAGASGAGWSAGKTVGAAAAAATIIGVGIVAGDSGTKSSSGSGSDSGSSDSGGSSGGGSGGGSGSSDVDVSVCNPAVYSVTTMLSGDDPGGHASADSFDGNWEVTCPSGAGTTEVVIRNQSGSGPDPAWSCTVGSGGDCFATDTPCVWGGMSTTCTFDGAFTSSPGMSGVMIIGFDGSLPPGDPVFFDVNGVRQ